MILKLNHFAQNREEDKSLTFCVHDGHVLLDFAVARLLLTHPWIENSLSQYPLSFKEEEKLIPGTRLREEDTVTFLTKMSETISIISNSPSDIEFKLNEYVIGNERIGKIINLAGFPYKSGIYYLSDPNFIFNHLIESYYWNGRKYLLTQFSDGVPYITQMISLKDIEASIFESAFFCESNLDHFTYSERDFKTRLVMNLLTNSFVVVNISLLNKYYSTGYVNRIKKNYSKASYVNTEYLKNFVHIEDNHISENLENKVFLEMKMKYQNTNALFQENSVTVENDLPW